MERDGPDDEQLRRIIRRARIDPEPAGRRLFRPGCLWLIALVVLLIVLA